MFVCEREKEKGKGKGQREREFSQAKCRVFKDKDYSLLFLVFPAMSPSWMSLHFSDYPYFWLLFTVSPSLPTSESSPSFPPHPLLQLSSLLHLFAKDPQSVPTPLPCNQSPIPQAASGKFHVHILAKHTQNGTDILFQHKFVWTKCQANILAPNVQRLVRAHPSLQDFHLLEKETDRGREVHKVMSS